MQSVLVEHYKCFIFLTLYQLSTLYPFMVCLHDASNKLFLPKTLGSNVNVWLSLIVLSSVPFDANEELKKV